MPITFKITDNIIGEPESPYSVSIVCMNSKSFNISLTFPLATSISSLGNCNVNISISLY